MDDAIALVGVTGGAGTTRLTVECAATLARAGHSVAVLDAAFGTQGLARYVEGRIDPDVTAVLTDDAALGDALVDVWPDADGRVALCPARAPFERVARAKTTEAARELESCVADLTVSFDHVLIDVPPVAANQAVAAATAADRRALVAPDTTRGLDHLPQMRGRLVDLGSEADAVVATFADGSGDAVTDADYAVPTGERAVTRPTCLDPDDAFAPAVAETAAGLCGRELDLEFPDGGLLR